MADKVPVLVTGGAGYIGSHAVLALKDAGFPVAVIDNLTTGFRWAIPDDVAFYEGDIADEALLDRICAEQGIQAVMHFAGSIIVPESVEKPLKYYLNNTAKTRALLESAVRNGVKHFIFSSTAAVYGIPETVPVHEELPKAPINPYGTSKLMTELMLNGVTAAQMNMLFALAMMAVDRAAMGDQFREERLADPVVLGMIRRITVDADPEYDRGGDASRHAARLTVRTRAGATHGMEVLNRPGSPGRPLSSRELERKFETLAAAALPQAPLGEIKAAVQHLEGRTAADLVALVTGRENRGSVLDTPGGASNSRQA